MKRTVLITGATDGIGLETAASLAASGCEVLLHGRSPAKLENVRQRIDADGFVADLSDLAAVAGLADALLARHPKIDVVINNAGVFVAPETTTASGIDLRFVVNTIAPYLLTRRLLPAMPADGRIVNLSSAAQAPVDLRALAGEIGLDHGMAYAQSKLALTMWSRHLADELGAEGPAVIAVNPGSKLATKMVREAYGVAGADLSIGSEILCRAALSDEFAQASGRYYDNDARRFAPPHPDALDPAKNAALVAAIEALLA